MLECFVLQGIWECTFLTSILFCFSKAGWPWTLDFSCLCLASAGIPGVDHQDWVKYTFLNKKKWTQYSSVQTHILPGSFRAEATSMTTLGYFQAFTIYLYNLPACVIYAHILQHSHSYAGLSLYCLYVGSNLQIVCKWVCYIKLYLGQEKRPGGQKHKLPSLTAWVRSSCPTWGKKTWPMRVILWPPQKHTHAHTKQV